MNYRPAPNLGSLVQSLRVLSDLYRQVSSAPKDTLTGWSLDDRDPRIIDQIMPFYDWFYQHYFQVETDGWENVPQGKVLLIGSHNGGLAAPDMVMMIYDWLRNFGSDRLAYGIMEPRIWQASPALGRLATQMGAVRTNPKMILGALRRDAAVLLYPGGIYDVFRPFSLRNQIFFNGQKGFIKIAIQEEVPIVPLISHGAHSTLIILGDIYPQIKQFLQQFGLPWFGGIDPSIFPVYLGLPWGISFGPLPNIPLPLKIHTRVCPPIVFERYGKEAARDRQYVAQCYFQVCTQMQQELDRLVEEVGAEFQFTPNLNWLF
ncbi:MAG: 1-acyl-sn-glycerol-3-phosphate acyltransferase [Cyanobacteria bacterium J06621_8]